MFNDNISEVMLSFSGPAETITEIRTMIDTYQVTSGADVRVLLPALLPVEGDSRDEKIDWCLKYWGVMWSDSDTCPEWMMGDRTTTFAKRTAEHDNDAALTGIDTIEASFYTSTGYPTEAIRQISLKWPDVLLVVAWDDPVKRTLGASMVRNGVRQGHHEDVGDNYPAPINLPEDLDDADKVYAAVDEWLNLRAAAIAHATKMAMGVLVDDEVYERPVNATGVASEENYGEFIIAEIQNGKLSATIVTVPPDALSGNDYIEVFPTMSKYRVIVGVSTEWFDALVCEANGWDPDSDEVPELDEDVINSSEAMREAVGKIMSEAMVRTAVYFKAKGLV